MFLMRYFRKIFKPKYEVGDLVVLDHIVSVYGSEYSNYHFKREILHGRVYDVSPAGENDSDQLIMAKYKELEPNESIGMYLNSGVLRKANFLEKRRLDRFPKR